MGGLKRSVGIILADKLTLMGVSLFLNCQRLAAWGSIRRQQRIQREAFHVLSMMLTQPASAQQSPVRDREDDDGEHRHAQQRRLEAL